MRAFLIMVPLLIAGCTMHEPEATSASAAATPAGAQSSCIEVTRVAGRRAEGNRALVFELDDGRVFRNDLQESCPGIERADSFGSLSIDPVDNRLCRNDFVRAYDPADLPVGGIKSVPRCRLGIFTQVAGRH
jgi:hypothetical protein